MSPKWYKPSVPSPLRRRSVLVIVLVALVALPVIGVSLARSRTPGCDVPTPSIELPEQLRTVGELAQPLDITDPRDLQDASVRAATALYGDLVGATADRPVSIAPAGSQVYTVTVVPLRVQRGRGSSSVAGLVAFRLDCGGRAYFDGVDDLLRTAPGQLAGAFPAVDSTSAAARLGARTVRLVYSSSPFHPAWQDPTTGRTTSAEAVVVTGLRGTASLYSDLTTRVQRSAAAGPTGAAT